MVLLVVRVHLVGLIVAMFYLLNNNFKIFLINLYIIFCFSSE
jgi:hypothetical protein